MSIFQSNWKNPDSDLNMYAPTLTLLQTIKKDLEQARRDKQTTLLTTLITLYSEASMVGVAQCANFNSPGQIVISGSVDGVKKAMELCKDAGAKVVKELVVSAAFHSSLMQSAKEKLKTALDATNFYKSKIPVYTNVTAKPVDSISEIKSMLYEQVTAPVRWDETIRNMIDDGVEEFSEIGPGNVLQGLIKRINPDVKRFGIDKFEDVERFL